MWRPIQRWAGNARRTMRRLRFSKFLRPILLYPLSIVLILTAGTLLLWTYPRQAAESLGDEASALERRQLENDYRATGAQLFLGLGVLVGIYLTYRRIRAAERQAVNAEQGQITERFTRAIEQLGKPGDENLAIRLGGIYALERVMRDSETDFPTVQEVLAAFIREETTKTDSAPRRPRTDVQAALSVLGRNPARKPVTAPPINLRGAWLVGAELARAHLERADFTGAHLTEADLSGAYLTEASLEGAHLEGADLTEADLSLAILSEARLKGADLVDASLAEALVGDAYLERADLFEAYLEGADLSGAHLEHASLLMANLEGADLREAHLEGANLGGANLLHVDLRGVNLVGVRELRQAQIDVATTDAETVLPQGLEPPGKSSSSSKLRAHHHR